MNLSPRQLAVQRFEREEQRRRENRKRWLCSQKSEEQFSAELDSFLALIDPEAYRQIEDDRKAPVKPKPKPKPLSPETKARLDELERFFEQHKRTEAARKERELNARCDALGISRAKQHKVTTDERVKRMLQYKPPKLDTLDDKIRGQINVQPEMNRRELRMLYNAWCAYNAAYFGNRLNLPIITVEKLSRNVQADCSTNGTPCTIRFSPRTLWRSDTHMFDVLLHEMIHQALAQHHGSAVAWDERTKGHHQPFADIANRIAKARGWPDVSATKQHPCDSLPEAAYWPPRSH